MQQVTSFPASSLESHDVSAIIADYVELDQLRVMRKLLVARFATLAAFAAMFGLLIHGLSPYARWGPLILFLTPPAWAWIAERRLERRLTRRLDRVDGAVTRTISLEDV